MRDGVLHNGREISEVKVLMEQRGEMIRDQQIKIQLMTDALERQTELLQTLVSATHAQKQVFDVDTILSTFGP
jgi:hypothetical protein